jgi:hypothetical protein
MIKADLRATYSILQFGLLAAIRCNPIKCPLCGQSVILRLLNKLLTSSPNNVLISKKAPKQYAAIGKKYLQLSRLDNAFSDGFNEPFNSLGVTRLSKCHI